MKMIKRLKGLWKQDKGAALALVATSILVVFGMAAFGSDLAWAYLNSSRVQRGADAAALAGVVWMPSQFGTASTTAHDAAIKNGYDDANPETTVIVSPVAGEPHQLQVAIAQEVPTFFLKIFGMDTLSISQSAIAEFLPPLKLGSPFSRMGNDPNCFNPPSPANPCSGNYWIGIYGTHINTSNGDAFSSACNGGAPMLTCTPNPMYRPEGYLFGVIPSSSSLTIEGLDPNHRYDGGVHTTPPAYGDAYRAGDNLMTANNQPGPTTHFTLWDHDSTPTNLSDNGGPLCTATFDSIPQIPEDQNPPFNPPSPTWVWENVCSGVPVTAGELYVLQVQVEGPGSQGDGSNRFSLRVGGGNGQIFGIRDFSVFYNSHLATSYMYLAEVPSSYAGKTLVIEGFDPGDVGEQGFLSLRAPTGPGTWATFASCEKFVSTTTNQATYPATGITEAPCEFIADNRGSAPPEHNFQNKWFKLEVQIPTGYSCTSNCWWQIGYAFSSAPSDHVTWKAYVIGNPIHLVG